jgi:hypothetical protein
MRDNPCEYAQLRDQRSVILRTSEFEKADVATIVPTRLSFCHETHVFT